MRTEFNLEKKKICPPLKNKQTQKNINQQTNKQTNTNTDPQKSAHKEPQNTSESLAANEIKFSKHLKKKKKKKSVYIYTLTHKRQHST